MRLISIDTSQYREAFDRFVSEARLFLGDVEHWIQSLSSEEQMAGMAAFILVLMVLIVKGSRKKEDPGSNGRQFSGALVLVIIFAFGAGFAVESGGGSMSHLFAR